MVLQTTQSSFSSYQEHRGNHIGLGPLQLFLAVWKLQIFPHDLAGLGSTDDQQGERVGFARESVCPMVFEPIWLKVPKNGRR